MLAYLRDDMERSASRLTPFSGLHATGVEIGEDGPVAVTLQHVSAPEETSTIRARYVVGCDGSRG
jgi:phenol 2-monooxygenase